MRKLQILKTLVHYIWFFSTFGIIGMLIFILYMFFTNEAINFPIEINGKKIVLIDFASKALFTLNFIGSCFFVYGLYQLNKVLDLFSKRIIFEEIVIIYLNQIGIKFLIASALISIPFFIYNMIYHDGFSIGIGSGFSSIPFTASLGLLFMVFSEVFRIAKVIKEENELTV